LCLSACNGDGEVKKKLPPPEDNIRNSPKTVINVHVSITIPEYSYKTRRSAVAERPRDASCLSVVSFNIPKAQFFYY